MQHCGCTAARREPSNCVVPPETFNLQALGQQTAGFEVLESGSCAICPVGKYRDESIISCQDRSNFSDTFPEAPSPSQVASAFLVVTCVPLFAAATFGLRAIIPLQMDQLIVPRASVAA